MSVPDTDPIRKPPSRLWLYGPFVLLLLGIAGLSGAWLWARGQTAARMDAAAADLRRAGYRIDWAGRRISGYPFRMDVTLTGLDVREPSGWAVSIPKLDGEAYIYTLGQWVMAAPEGLTFTRPEAGPVKMTGKRIRASLSHVQALPPSFDFEGEGLAFASLPGAQPFALSGADKMEFHLRAGPDDQGGVFMSLDGGKARLSGLLARIAQGKPVSFVWNSTLSKMSAFTGEDWSGMVRRWADAGGQMTVRNAGLTAGDALMGANAGTLTVGTDGRLRGELRVTLREAPRALSAMGETGVLPPDTAQAASEVAQARQGPEGAARATLYFQAGRTTLGPVAIGPAPKIFTPR